MHSKTTLAQAFLAALASPLGAWASSEYTRVCSGPQTHTKNVDSQEFTFHCATSWAHYHSYVSNIATPEDCARRCTASPACAAVVWDSGAKTCWISDNGDGSTIGAPGAVLMRPGSGAQVPCKDQVDQCNSDKIALEQDVETHKKKATDCETKGNTCATSLGTCISDKATCDQEAGKVQQEKAALEQEVETLKHKVTDCETKGNTCSTSLGTCTSDKATCDQKLNQVQKELDDLKQKEKDKNQATQVPANFVPAKNDDGREVIIGGKRWKIYYGKLNDPGHWDLRNGNPRADTYVKCMEDCAANYPKCVRAAWVNDDRTQKYCWHRSHGQNTVQTVSKPWTSTHLIGPA
ncbi:hypothetical protein BDV25DRAFT_143361 [Aspergillus avenaceus]|uniref:Apple domain-containing protein n=1 Tax=Aspergillus avenaceus TaxID=36643 RepID=A0A5N6TKA8_ASPAV|nr:hypothetical protein BDV25DRAFT_143361 [Aspergillus avenaceus]